MSYNKSSHGQGSLSEDVEDESIQEEVILSPVLSMLKLQTVSTPIDLSVAKVGCRLKSVSCCILICVGVNEVIVIPLAPPISI